MRLFSLIFFVFPLLASTASAQTDETLKAPGLKAPVEILYDHWGIPHIYAENDHDLFFAQGYSAARERLFQFELWRRQATGTVAEILGPREIERDAGTRLFMFRGDIEAEMRHYHPNGVEIISSYVEGVNAYIDYTTAHPDELPLEFELLGITPEKWTPEVVISRHQGLLGNIGAELNHGRAVAALGPDRVNELMDFGPGTPDLTLDSSITLEMLEEDILGIYNAFRRPVRFMPQDLAANFRGVEQTPEFWLAYLNEEEVVKEDREAIGSNNWVVAGSLTQSGYPIMANDPHRVQAAPSLRYWAHLVAPGWNVIGGGEPSIPGISIGHNEYGAWGLTVFQTDGEDLYVYDLNPDNPNEYRYEGNWEAMRQIEDEIAVKDQDPVAVTHRYTRHGPVVFVDEARNKAYAIRAAWMEIGGSPYLASLRMDQAKTWEEFRDACTYSHIPGENMIWADREGNIGWQAVGIAPIRRHWSGLLPVPGDGSHEWDGYLPIRDKPHVENPEKGFFATANENLVPPNYPFREAVGWEWSDPFRSDRLAEVLGSGRQHTMMDMMRLQTDYLSIPARDLVPLLRHQSSDRANVEKARLMLMEWDFLLEPNSVEAGIYVAWERRLQERVPEVLMTETERDYISRLSMSTIISALMAPGAEFGSDPLVGRDLVVMEALIAAVEDMTERLGANMDNWQYGQADYKHAYLPHPMSLAVDEETRKQLDVGPIPRGGNSYTVNNTGWTDNQRSGASFRIIVDTADWDAAVGMNTPGQSGRSDHPQYRNLFKRWGQDEFFPVFYSREKIEAVTSRRLELQPE